MVSVPEQQSSGVMRGLDRFEGHFAAWVHSNLNFPLLRRISGVNPLVIYYHIVSDHEVPHVSSLYSFRSVREFTRDLEVFLRFFRAISLQDLLSSLDGKKVLPRNSFLLTFDDGLKECYEVIAPILKKKGVPAVFFLCKAFVDNKAMAYDHKKSLLASALRQKRLTPAMASRAHALMRSFNGSAPDILTALLSVSYQQREVLDSMAELLGVNFADYLKSARPYLNADQAEELMKAGHALGAHSIDHPRYSDLQLNEQLHQTRESVQFVKDQFAIKYGAFAFPSSDANVSKRFYDEALGKNGLDVCFGNHGLMKDCIPRSLQRSAMEKTWMPAEAILGKSYLRRFAKRFTGQLVVQRT
ncbi:MAG TPA: polysaccharide deacetylase family protein [Cyclobacteriaceae bacterium]|nr:polysaccharide deacetylase family protein [Cyclobacteriaceae bacterium]